MNLRIQLPTDADRYGWLKINANVSGCAPFMNTDTDSADATGDPYDLSVMGL